METIIAHHLVCDLASPDKEGAVSQAAVGHFHAYQKRSALLHPPSILDIDFFILHHCYLMHES